MTQVRTGGAETETPPRSGNAEESGEAFRDLGRLLHPMRRELTVIAVMNGASAVVALVPYLAVAFVTDRLLSGSGDIGTAAVTAIAVAIGALALRQILYIGGIGYAHLVEARLRRSLREKILDHIGAVPLGKIGSRGAGRIRRLVIDDTAAIHTIVAHVLAEAAGAFTGVAVSLAVLFAVSWPLAAGYFAVFLIVAAVAKAVTPRIGGNVQEDFADAQSELAAAAVELTEGIAEIKSHGLTGGFMRRFRESLDRYSRTSYDGTRVVIRPMSVITSFVLPGVLLGPMLLLCWVALELGWASPFGVIVFLLVGIGVPQTFFGTLSLVQGARLGAAAAGRIARFLGEPALPEPADPAPFTRADAAGDITFEDVAFGYGDDRLVLDGLSLTVPAGATVALVGRSGSGKTTVTRLLARFWEPSGGSIRIGGRDIAGIRGEDLLRNVSFMFQDVMLAGIPVRDNIRLARPDATDADVVAAAKAARIHDRIMELPNGYDSIAGSGDAQFSGGEQQRLCIARVFLQDAPVLVLDEATSFLDRENEELLRGEFARFFAGRTVITVTHRLSAVADADSIAVIEGGRVAEQGTHDELLARPGPYRRMWEARTAEGIDR
ncbi:ABC transporter ATP-binding protein [Corynebacterium hansenii]|uniref:ABC transporter ATP-binding protein n=1 Tax=Corynebacterium hansenii TaxID=394964 RepID=A0ABV7ZLB7_9CORY|nr:ABC transporter ATP-binding protein [Corynebacterium hansenii]WJY99234.1 Iron import ATP-binding/permease protein IrtA [Corynebacterium hansenii]